MYTVDYLHVDYMYSIDAYSRPGRGTRAQRLVLGVMGRLVDAGIAGHSGDILVGSWPCMALYGLVWPFIPALVPLLGTRSSIILG